MSAYAGRNRWLLSWSDNIMSRMLQYHCSPKETSNMKKTVKRKVTDVLFNIYEPLISRVEKFRATMMWREGVRQCIKMYKELGSPRVYLFFDAKHMVWSPMTYEPNKGMKPSLRMLRRMGKARGVSRVTGVTGMKEFSFYYTPSKWGALGCEEDNRVRTEKLTKWIAYYMTHLSEPMRKCREYRQSASSCRC